MSEYLENQFAQINDYIKGINKCLMKIKAFEDARDLSLQSEIEEMTESVIIEFKDKGERKNEDRH